MRRDPQLEAIAREERKRLGGACSHCGSTNVVGARSHPPLCYACHSDRKPEFDHVAGRGSLPRSGAVLDPNWHRRVTEIRSAVGADLLRVDRRDPFLQAVHLMIGLASYVVLIAEWLALVDERLRELVGEDVLHALPALPFRA